MVKLVQLPITLAKPTPSARVKVVEDKMPAFHQDLRYVNEKEHGETSNQVESDDSVEVKAKDVVPADSLIGFSIKEIKIVGQLEDFFTSNLRKLNRIINTYRFLRVLVSVAREEQGGGSEHLELQSANVAHLFKLVMFAEQWPYRLAWLQIKLKEELEHYKRDSGTVEYYKTCEKEFRTKLLWLEYKRLQPSLENDLAVGHNAGNGNMTDYRLLEERPALLEEM